MLFPPQFHLLLLLRSTFALFPLLPLPRPFAYLKQFVFPGPSFPSLCFLQAPELLRRETGNTPASDVYSFGIILCEVYSRKDPYEGDEIEDAKEILKMVMDPAVNKRPPVPRACPAQLASLMSDCLVAKADERPTFEELDKRLQRVDVQKADTTSAQITNHRDKSSVSLFDIFPKHIAEALRDGREIEQEHKDCVTIFFSDVIGELVSKDTRIEPDFAYE